MKILSIDTASNICGVSILEDHHLIVKLDQDTGRTHSENLMPMIDQALQQAHLSLNEIDLLVCDKGPGSFTGIRIGIATVKAFQDCLSIPCVGVSSLESLAYSISQGEFIASILDSKNNNCYFALYQRKDAHYMEVLPPTATTIEEAMCFGQKMIPSNVSVTFVGDGSIVFQKQIEQNFKNNCIFAPSENNILNSYFVGLSGLDKWKKNELTDVLPLYLRKPQAQRQLEEKFKNMQITPMLLEDFVQISNQLTSDFDAFWSDQILKEELNAKNSYYLVAKFRERNCWFCWHKSNARRS